MKFTFNLNKKEFSMSKTVSKFALVAGVVLAMAFIFSCSLPEDDGGGGGGDPQSYSYCIYIEAQVCFAGPYKECPGGGIPSNSCPYGDVEPSSSSSSVQAQWVWSLDSEGARVPSQGYWFGYGDENENGPDGVGGCSSTNFPLGSKEEEGIVTDAWKALGGTITYTFNDDCTYKYRYAGFGFHWFDEGDTRLTISDEGDPTGSATGIRLKYSLTADFNVKCVIEISSDGVTAYDNYTFTLVKEGSNIEETFPFSGFAQANWGTRVTWSEAWQASWGVRFKCEAGNPSIYGPKQAALTIDEISFQAQGRP